MKITHNALPLSLFLFIAFYAQAQAPRDDKNITVFSSDYLTQVVLHGSAAAALYKDLSTRDGVEEFNCGDGKAVEVAPFVCIQKDGSSICLSILFPGSDRFVIPDSCEGPNPSEIDLGSIPPSLKIKAKPDTLRSQL